ncbi:MAG TPA: branched-chain amino acid ABC transporter permease [Candidatus Dormibacteraeota bacterium]|nr:branched-chain amino acid ABC transporter permease [Candidatus Dormibacteraeota bacterium]
MSIDILASGVADGVLLFLIASGLTLIFGVLRILNFAHGGFFMLGAYLVYQVLGGRATDGATFLVIAAGAGLAVAAVGIASEATVFRRLYTLRPVNSLLGTFALLLVLEGLGQLGWGLSPRSQAVPSSFSALMRFGGGQVPAYDLVLFAVGAMVAVGLQLLVNHTPYGRRVRAVAEDRYTASLLGININAVFVPMFALGIFLAGLGGALAAPTLGLTPDIAIIFIIEAFAVVIIGGLGSIPGSLVAALGLGLLNSELVHYAPALADFSVYIALVAVLLVRPQGLLGRIDSDAL